MGDIYFSINGASVLAELRTVQGRLHEAAYALADALQLAGSRGYGTAEV
jgi:cytochrome c-type biogenesis protein CcmH/NrfG